MCAGLNVARHTDTVSPRSEEVTVVDVDVVVVVDIAVAAAIASAAPACVALDSQLMVRTTANASHWLRYWRQPELYAPLHTLLLMNNRYVNGTPAQAAAPA